MMAGMIIQANAQSVVSNIRGSPVCYVDSATKNMSLVHKGCIEQAKKGLYYNARECTKGVLECALNEARPRGRMIE